MRIDLLLSRLCLFKTRSQAGKACDAGRVRLNGTAARSSREVRTGDRIVFRDQFDRHEQEVEILGIPEGSVSREAARGLYRTVSKREITDAWDSRGSDGR